MILPLLLNGWIPLYEESGTSKCTKVDRKFVEVIHNSEQLFIRKTTLVWLFQENERISSDRLFRVRAHRKHPVI